MDRLPVELLYQIFELLEKSPKDFARKTKGSALSDLASIARTSSRFTDVARKLLYRRLSIKITDVGIRHHAQVINYYNTSFRACEFVK